MKQIHSFPVLYKQQNSPFTVLSLSDLSLNLSAIIADSSRCTDRHYFYCTVSRSYIKCRIIFSYIALNLVCSRNQVAHYIVFNFRIVIVNQASPCPALLVRGCARGFSMADVPSALSPATSPTARIMLRSAGDTDCTVAGVLK